jgi:hypothetical protein
MNEYSFYLILMPLARERRSRRQGDKGTRGRGEEGKRGRGEEGKEFYIFHMTFIICH